MQFEIHGKEYFLAFVEEERRWFVFSPDAQGMQRIPVYVDVAKFERGGLMESGRHHSRS